MTVSSPRRKTDSDLGVHSTTLTLEPWTEAETAEKQARAARTVAGHLGQDERLADVLEMLGLRPYVSARKVRNTTPILHGQRSGYTNRGCGRTGAPPCPATPSCKDAHNEYYRDRRAAGRAPASRRCRTTGRSAA